MLDTKKVHIMLKKGKTSAQIMEEFSISSEEDFEKELRQAYTSSSSYGKVTRLLDQNDKMRKKKKSEETEPTTSEKIDNVPTEQSNQDFSTEQALEIEPEDPENLDEVLSKIDETQANINVLERKHQTASSNRTQIRSRLDVKKKQLLKLFDNVKQIEKEVETLRNEYNAEEANMKEFNELIATAKAELESLNSKREALETLFILIYTDSIEINGESIEQIPDSWKQIYETIRNDERLDFLRVIEQKTLSKFLSLATILPNNRKQELCFDSNELETAYNMVKDLF